MSREPVTEQSARIQGAVDFVRDALAREVGARTLPSSPVAPRIGIVLGSGLGALVDTLNVAVAIPFDEIPGFPVSTVEGHAGRLVVGVLDGALVAVMQGRVHLYEGYAPSDVVFPTRVLARLGAASLIVTNAAGSVNPKFKAREIMLISDHLNLSGASPLSGPNDMALGPRFPDMTDAYDLEYKQVARDVATECGIALREGVYAGMLGPAYETPSEIRMLRTLGADAVGMSTVSEVIAARHMGVRVIGLSCLSNMAAGLAEAPLTHEEVKTAADALQGDLSRLVAGIVRRIAA